jgi:hypothetical protein
VYAQKHHPGSLLPKKSLSTINVCGSNGSERELIV